MSRVLPIRFNTEMVRAILDGRKTVTRRICKDGDAYSVPDMEFYDAARRTYGVHNYSDLEHTHTNKLSIVERPCPRCPGDILYVRETYCPDYFDSETQYGNKHGYKADYDVAVLSSFIPKPRWVPSIHMPKKAARIWLKVTDVRVERLQEISDEQAIAEGANWKNGKNVGFEEKMRRSAIERFAEIWDSTIKKPDLDKYGWKANPWVWVIEFERCGKPGGEGETESKESH